MKERDYKLDLIRLISIFLVVVVHYSNYYNRRLVSFTSTDFIFATTYNAIARIAVPLFFMISGALTLGRDMDPKKLAKKVGHFIMILLVWSAIYVVFDRYYNQIYYDWRDILSLFYGPLKAHLWFMYAIIALYIISPFARILVKNMNHKLRVYFIVLWLVFCGCGRLLQIVFTYFEIQARLLYDLPLVQGTYYLGYFMVGYIIYDEVNKGYRLHKAINICAFVFSVIGIVVGTVLFSVHYDEYNDSFFNYRTFLMMNASISAFYLILQGKEIKSDKVKLALGKISPLLFGVYLIHIIFFNVLNETIDILNFHPAYGVPMFSAGVFVVSLLAVFIISNIPGVRKIVQ